MEEGKFKNKIDKIVKNIFEADMPAAGTTDDSRFIDLLKRYQSLFQPRADKVDTAGEIANFIVDFYESFFDKKNLTPAEFQAGLRTAMAKIKPDEEPSKTEPSMDLPMEEDSTIKESFTKMKTRLRIRD